VFRDLTICPESGLVAPEGYLRLTPAQHQTICNGAGTKQFDVPDRLFGLSITAAADVHDYMYKMAKNKRDMIIADIVFFLNMTILAIKKDRNAACWLERRMLLPRLICILGYFVGVYRFGICPEAGVVPIWARVLTWISRRYHG
jgi:hypothetical protein